MAISGITISVSRLQAVDFTIPYMQEPSAVAIKIFSNKWLYFLDPLSTGLLAVYMLMPLILGVVAWLLGHLHGCTTTLSRDRLGTRYRQLPGLYDIIGVFFGNIFLQGGSQLNRCSLLPQNKTCINGQ